MALPAFQAQEEDARRSQPTSSTAKANLDREIARVKRLREKNRDGLPVNSRRAANDNSPVAANDNWQEGGQKQPMVEGRNPQSPLQNPHEEKPLLDRRQAQELERDARQAALASQQEQAESEKAGFIRYSPAASVGLIKDLMDIAMIGSIPVVGTIITACFSLLIFLLLLFTKVNSSLLEIRWLLRRILLILAAFMIEGFVFGVNFFPLETMVVGLIFLLDRHASEKKIRAITELAGHLR